jgi:3-dehydroshikimate dehydratase
VTFWSFTIAQVVDWTARSGLKGIEWGDVHVPPGDRCSEFEAVDLCKRNNLAIPSYGSYYRLGQAGPEEFDSVLKTCLNLESPNLRIWAGDIGSTQISAAFCQRITLDVQRWQQMRGFV